MKTYMPLNGLRWSRNSGSANCDMPQSAVFGRPGGVNLLFIDSSKSKDACCRNRRHTNVKHRKRGRKQPVCESQTACLQQAICDICISL